MTAQSLLSIRDLVVTFRTPGGIVRAVDGVDLDVERGETLGVVGESGSGKTVTMLAALGLLPPSADCVVTGRALLDGQDLLAMDRRQLRAIRGDEVGMVFQDPLTSLHPTMRVVDQIAEAMLVHDRQLNRRDARTRAIELLERVGVSGPERRVKDYPHQWSGGMRQRAIIAMAIANSPRLLVADEPTTALDVTIQAQILDVLRQARDELGASTIFITHNLGVVAALAGRVTVMQAGRVVESGPVASVFNHPLHPHTVDLLATMPRLDRAVPARPEPAERTKNVLVIEDLVTHFPASGGRVVQAVDGVSLHLDSGETLGLLGESGCGKSTVARTALRLVDPTSGRVQLLGQDITHMKGRPLRTLRRSLSMVFQDPYASLNPRMTVGDIVAEPLRIAERYQSAGGPRRIRELLNLVGIDTRMMGRRPAEFSGGERQRIGIARALALNPTVLVLDEPVSSLDVSNQAHVVSLLDRLQRELGLAYLIISHDLALIREISDRIAVMYLGKIVETGTREQVYERPSHPYTQSLLSAIPSPDLEKQELTQRIVLVGELPDATDPPSGCRFRTRCWKATAECERVEPELVERPGVDHATACLHAEVLVVNG